MKKILVIVGHPVAGSLCHTLAEDYKRSAEAAGATIDVLDLARLSFDLDLLGGLHATDLEGDLADAQKRIADAQHLVFVHPNWWGTYPARLTGFLDRVLLPGFAFQYQKNSSLPRKLLAGKTARLVVTMDGPSWWYRWAMGRGGDRALERSVLWYCGVKTVGRYHVDSLRPRHAARVDAHRAAVGRLAARDARVSFL